MTDIASFDIEAIDTTPDDQMDEVDPWVLNVIF